MKTASSIQTPLDGDLKDDASPVDLWAEIHRLRAAVQGPEGYSTWQEAATAERIRRVKAEASMEMKNHHEPWFPYLVDRADGVKGRYAIGRWNPRGYQEVWSLRKHCWASASDDVLTLDQARDLMCRIVIPTKTA